MSKGSNSSSISLGVPGVLTIVFIVLKLCKVIDWSWLWVLSSTWIPLLIGIVMLILAIIYKAKRLR